MDAMPVDVEVHLSNGLPAFNVVGMPETAVKESKDRVRSAITSSKFEFPARRITVNLAPADVPKVGGRFDLPIALGILIASGQIEAPDLADYEIIGELALTGEVKGVTACLPTAVACQQANKKLLLPSLSVSEACLVEGLAIYQVSSLSEAAAHLCGQSQITVQTIKKERLLSVQNDLCLSDVKGQVQAKRALEIAASGGHHMLMSGPPGCGKTMLAQRFSHLLPELTIQQAIETAALYSISTIGFDPKFWRHRPIRSPHHSASATALIGGGSKPMPGEISLAHHGILFLDELPEFPRHVLDQLREPIEAGHINIVRANGRVTFKSDFQLIAAMNLCKCGFAGDSSQPNRCQCSAISIEKYRQKVSGPLMDRIDMHTSISRIPISDLQQLPKGETSQVVAERVRQAYHRQIDRQGCLNAKLKGEQFDKVCSIEKNVQQILAKAEQRFNLSARGYVKVLKIARTIADLQGENKIQKNSIMEALNFRMMESN